jgi:hypothetical protein
MHSFIHSCYTSSRSVLINASPALNAADQRRCFRHSLVGNPDALTEPLSLQHTVAVSHSNGTPAQRSKA